MSKFLPYCLMYLCLLSYNKSVAQSVQNSLKVGDVLPSEWLAKLKSASSSEFPNNPEQPTRLYILDFWATNCSACIADFPRLEGLQYQFRDRVKVVSINAWQSKEWVEKVFRLNRSNAAQNKEMETPDSRWKGTLNYFREPVLAALIGDSSWQKLFPTEGVPHHAWVDGNGKVLAIVGNSNTSAANINYYLSTGTVPRMLLKPEFSRYDLSKTSLLKLWGEEGFTYQNEGLRARGYYEGNGGGVKYQRLGVVDTVAQTIRYSFVNTSIADLYKAIWIELNPDYWRRPAFMQGDYKVSSNGDTAQIVKVPDYRLQWEVSMPEYYIGPISYNERGDLPGKDAWSARAKFCVEFVVPLENQEVAPQLLLKAVNEFFSQELGISGRIEKRKRLCVILRKFKNYKSLVSLSESASKEYDASVGVERYTGYPFEHLVLDYIPYRFDLNLPPRSVNEESYRRSLHRNYLVIDQTGITGDVDIVLHDVPISIQDPIKAINKRLEGTGLGARKSIEEFDMMVISEQKVIDNVKPKGIVYTDNRGGYELIY